MRFYRWVKKWAERVAALLEEEMERAVHARVPGCTVITPERLRWYHMGLSVWA